MLLRQVEKTSPGWRRIPGFIVNRGAGTSLEVLDLRLHAPNAGGMGKEGKEKERKALSNKRTETGATGSRTWTWAGWEGRGVSPAASFSVLSQESSLCSQFPHFPFKLKVPSDLMLLPMVFSG